MNSRIKKVVGLLVSLALTAGAASAQAAGDKYKDSKPKPPKQQQIVSVPEPTTLGLLATGVAAIGLGTFLRRRRKR